jgi:hypothetical protein
VKFKTAADEAVAKVGRLEHDLAAVARRLSQAYADHLDGKIDEAIWSTLSAGWSAEQAPARTSDRTRPPGRLVN